MVQDDTTFKRVEGQSTSWVVQDNSSIEWMEVDTIAKEDKDEITSEVVYIETILKVVDEENAAKVVESTIGVVKDETQPWLIPPPQIIGPSSSTSSVRARWWATWKWSPARWRLWHRG